MTEIDFHFNVHDGVHHACRLLRKAAISVGAQVVALGDEETLEKLDASLWDFSATDFVAHCRDGAAAHILSRTPVVLACQTGQTAWPHREVLVNLGTELPSGFERFSRLIEIVGVGERERQAGRVRWRHYADRGYAITRHDLGVSRDLGMNGMDAT